LKQENSRIILLFFVKKNLAGKPGVAGGKKKYKSFFNSLKKIKKFEKNCFFKTMPPPDYP